MTIREKAFRLVPAMTDHDVARELDVTVTFVRNEIRAGRLIARQNGQITGSAFSDYLIRKRQSAG